MGDFPTYEDFREEWLASVRAGHPSTVQLGNRFAHKLITQWRDVSPGTEDIHYCDGAGDGGIDIAFLYHGDADAESQEGDTWYLVQSKYGAAFRGPETLIVEGHKVVETLDGRRTRLSSLASGLLEQITNFRANKSELDRIVLVYATIDPLAEAELRAADDVRAMGRERIGPLFDVEAISVATIYERAREEAINGHRLHVRLSADLKESSSELLIGAIPLVDMYAFLKAYKAETGDLDRLYEKNVRKFLGARGKVNKKMHETLRSEPDRFGLFNNGITIVVTDFSRQGALIDLVDPYVVNGCQTTKTIWEVCQRILDAGGTGSSTSRQEWKEKATRGVVVTKIVKVGLGLGGEGLLQDITRYTNTQNAIRDKDFLALRGDLQSWKAQMAKDYQVYLEIQRGGWESQRALQKQHPEMPQFADETYANAFDLIKVYGAGWLGEAGLAFAKNAPFLPGGAVFKRIEDPQVTGSFDALDLYAGYRLDRAAEKLGFGRGANKPSRQQTRFLFYMIAVQILRDILVYASLPTMPRDISRAFVTLFMPENEPIAEELVSAAAETIDEYMQDGDDDCAYKEPAYRQLLNMNSFLKLEGLGKDTSPNLRTLVALQKKALGKVPKGSTASPRDQIIAIVCPALSRA
jgi:hypothetical protein